MPVQLTVLPLTPARWPDLETIFQARGWCMYYRRSGPQGAPPAGATRARANKAELKAGTLAGHEARRRSTRLVDHLFRRSLGTSWSRCRACASCWCGGIREEARGKVDRRLSSGPTGALERRGDVVRGEVHVRQCWFLGSSPPQAAETGRSPEARLRTSYRSNARKIAPSMGLNTYGSMGRKPSDR